ncbi:MAG: hypothetical protein MJZ01_03575 [Bacteroidales bacterium]|nr:hypothetical protein [Bacteroidales bacterium]
MEQNEDLLKKLEESLPTPDIMRKRGPNIRSKYEKARSGVVFEENGLWGIKDSNGDIVYKPEFKLISKSSSSVFFLKPDGAYIKIKNGCEEQGRLMEDEMPYIVNGKVGFVENNVVIVPPVYDNVSQRLGSLLVAEKDGEYTYYDMSGKQVLHNLRRFDGDDIPESRIYLRTNAFDKFTTCRFVGQQEINNPNVVKVRDEWVELERYSKDEILSMLIDPNDDLALTAENISLLTNEFSYEYSVYFTQSNSPNPLQDCLDQLARMKTFCNSWYYVVKIWQAPGEHVNASELRHFRHKLNETRQLGELTIAVGHDASLKSGEVRMLFITHYHERCFPADFEFEWRKKCRTLSISELKDAVPELKEAIKDEILEKNQAEVYQDQLLPVLENIRYSDNISWEKTENALEFFVAEGSPVKLTLLYSLFDAVNRIRHNDIEAALFHIRVSLWALKHGSSVTAVYKDMTPWDYTMEVSRNHNANKLGAPLLELKTALLTVGAKSCAQLKLEERTNSDYYKELDYMRLDDFSSKDMPSFCYAKL